jgi:GH24 family phage-related lysozyme (muramidase)
VQLGDSITEDQVYPYTEAAVARVLADIRRIIKRPLNEYQTAAMCSFVFNVGGRNLEESTKLLPALEAGRWEDAAEALKDFLRAWGKRQHPDGTMKWHRMAERGLLIRRYAEGCLLLGYDWEPWCHTGRISLAETVEWQPNWVDPKGIRTGGRYYDVVDWDATTSFDAIERFAITTPLPSPELTLTQKAEPAPSVAPASAGQPVSDPQPQTPAAPAPVKEPAKTSPDAAVASKISPNVDTKPAPGPVSGLPGAGPAPLPQSPQGQVAAPVPAPRLPDPPIPIGQQTSAVDAARKSEEWSSSPKAMIFSRRAWGLFLVLFGRLWMLKTGSNAVLGTVSDPLVMAMFSGFMVMMVGEIVQWWGEKKATRPLR